MPPLVTIVILNWNGRELLETCLHSIDRHTKYANYRIVVVDNGSTDGSVTMLREVFPNVHRIENDQNRGFGPANNQAFQQFSETDYFLLLNNDIEITNDSWLSTFVDFAEENGSDITGCRLEYPDGRLQHGGGIVRPGWPPAIHINESTETNIQDSPDSVWRPDYVTGAAFLIRQTVVETANGFDDSFIPAYYEETDLCLRAARCGFDIWYTPEPTLIHHEASSTDGTSLFWFHNQLRFVLLNFPLHWLLIQVLFELRGLVGHLYNGRSLREVYGPIISSLPQLLVHRLTR